MESSLNIQSLSRLDATDLRATDKSTRNCGFVTSSDAGSLPSLVEPTANWTGDGQAIFY